MEPEQAILYKGIEADMINASALMEAESLLDRENQDYFRGFLQGYAHCLKLAESLDALHQDEETFTGKKKFKLEFLIKYFNRRGLP